MNTILDTVRRVPPPETEFDNSHVITVRGRFPRWTSTPPNTPGWYWLRLVQDRSRSSVVELKRLSDLASITADPVEWSDRRIARPLEPDEPSELDLARRRIADLARRRLAGRGLGEVVA